jgi:hypothetical protein
MSNILNYHLKYIYYISFLLYELQHNPYTPLPLFLKIDLNNLYHPIKKQKK